MGRLKALDRCSRCVSSERWPDASLQPRVSIEPAGWATGVSRVGRESIFGQRGHLSHRGKRLFPTSSARGWCHPSSSASTDLRSSVKVARRWPTRRPRRRAPSADGPSCHRPAVPRAEAAGFDSNQAMEHAEPIDNRLTELEVKASYTEDMLDQLNQVVIQQQNQIDRLVREVAALRERSTSADDGGFRSLRDELPPHY